MDRRLHISRRAALRLVGITGLGAWAAACRPMEPKPANFAYPTPTLRPVRAVAPADAIERLLVGNGRYALDLRLNPGRTEPRRTQIAAGQNPFVVILTDSDSRVTPEVIFDQGLGDLFVIRVAGLVLDDEVLGSIEYAVEHLGVKAIMVLGPERSGAVRTALAAVLEHQPLMAELDPLVEGLRPAITAAMHRSGDVWENTINENTLRVAERLAATGPLLHDFVAIGELKIVAGRYDLDTGLITMLKRPVGYVADETHEETADAHGSEHDPAETGHDEPTADAQDDGHSETGAEATPTTDAHGEATQVDSHDAATPTTDGHGAATPTAEAHGEVGHAEATPTPAAPDAGHGDLVTATPEATH